MKAARGLIQNIKIPSCQPRKCHCRGKTILWLFYLHNLISYTGKMTFVYKIRTLFACVPLHCDNKTWQRNTKLFHYAWNGIFQVWGSITCLLIHWLLKSPVHQQALYLLCRTDYMYCCCRLPLLGSNEIRDTIQNVTTSFVIFKTIQHVNS